MNKIILYIFLLANIANAKIINIVVLFKTAERQATEQAHYEVDPYTKIWQLKNFLFNRYLLNPNDYVLAKQGIAGFQPIGDNVLLGKYEPMADEEPMLFILPKEYLSPGCDTCDKEDIEEQPPKEEAKKEEVKKEEPPKEEPPKEEVKKDEPPKEEVKKDEPPKEEVKKDEPPKEEPPKEEVKKDEPPKEEVKKDEPPKEEVKKEEPK